MNKKRRNKRRTKLNKQLRKTKIKRKRKHSNNRNYLRAKAKMIKRKYKVKKLDKMKEKKKCSNLRYGEPDDDWMPNWDPQHPVCRLRGVFVWRSSVHSTSSCVSLNQKRILTKPFRQHFAINLFLFSRVARVNGTDGTFGCCSAPSLRYGVTPSTAAGSRHTRRGGTTGLCARAPSISLSLLSLTVSLACGERQNLSSF